MESEVVGKTLEQASVFLSYSRKDLDFCTLLATRLESAGYRAIYDRREASGEDHDVTLSAQDEWWKQLKSMIAASDVMVFIVTPDSASSSVCDEEIVHAKTLGKRIIAILRHSVDFSDLPPRLRSLNISLDFRYDDHLPFAELKAELDRDVDWYRLGSHFARLAQRWSSSGCPENQLMPAGAIDEYDAWAARRPKNCPELSPLLEDFASRSLDKIRAELRARDVQQRDHRRSIAQSFVKPTEHAIVEGRFDAALRLAAAGAILSRDVNFEFAPDQCRNVRRAVWANRLYAILGGEELFATDLAFDSEWRKLAVSLRDKTVRILDINSGRETAMLQGHEQWLSNIGFSRNSRHLITASADGTARLWDVATGAEMRRFSVTERVHSAILSPDGRRLLTVAGESVQDQFAHLWDVHDGKLIALLENRRDQPSVWYADFTSDGSRVVTAGDDNRIRVWDASSGEALCAFPGGGPFGINPDKLSIVVSGSFQKTKILNIKTGKEMAALEGQSEKLTAIDFTGDGGRVACARRDANDVHISDAQSGATIAILRGHQASVNDVEFSHDGTKIVTASSDRSARIWDAATGLELCKFAGHDDDVAWVEFSPDSKKIATWSKDGKVRVWRADLGAETMFGDAISTMRDAAVSADGTLVATAMLDGSARIYDADTGVPRLRLQERPEGAINPLVHVKFDAAAKRVVTTSNDNIARMWDTESGRLLAKFSGHKGMVQGADFSPDGKRLVTYACFRKFDPYSGRIRYEGDTEAKCWDTSDARLVYDLRGHADVLTGASFSHDGTRILTSSIDGSARLWDAATGSAQIVVQGGGALNLARFNVDDTLVITIGEDVEPCIWDASSGSKICRLNGHDAWIQCAEFNPIGGQVATACGDGIIKLWNPHTGEELATLRGHEGPVTTLHFNKQGSLLLSAASDGTARVWSAEHYEELVVLHNVDARNSIALFMPDGRRILVVHKDEQGRIWNIERANPSISASVAMTGALSSGLEFRSSIEREDLLMQSAPDDLHTALLNSLDAGEAASAAAYTKFLARPFHPDCYLTPTSWQARAHQTGPSEANKPATNGLKRQERGTLLVLAVLIVLGVGSLLLAQFIQPKAGRLATDVRTILCTKIGAQMFC